MYRLIPTPRFERKLRKIAKLSKDESNRIKTILQLLIEDPFDFRLKTHKLIGKMSDYYSCSCGYDCRIIFSIERNSTDKQVIILIDFGSHDDVY
jgi:mRNA interferase YafQ